MKKILQFWEIKYNLMTIPSRELKYFIKKITPGDLPLHFESSTVFFQLFAMPKIKKVEKVLHRKLGFCN